jgi:hypothetical protein
MMEQSPGNDEMNAAALVGLGDGIPRGRYRLEKYRGDIEAGTMELEPYEVLEFENAYVNVGGAELLDIIGGAGSPVKFDNGHAYLGVGDSATATGAWPSRPARATRGAGRRIGAGSLLPASRRWPASAGPGPGLPRATSGASRRRRCPRARWPPACPRAVGAPCPPPRAPGTTSGREYRTAGR